MKASIKDLVLGLDHKCQRVASKSLVTYIDNHMTFLSLSSNDTTFPSPYQATTVHVER